MVPAYDSVELPLGLLDERFAAFEGKRMLWMLFVVFMVLWLLGVVSSYTLGGFIHLLLVVALVALLIQLVQGRSVA